MGWQEAVDGRKWERGHIGVLVLMGRNGDGKVNALGRMRRRRKVKEKNGKGEEERQGKVINEFKPISKAFTPVPRVPTSGSNLSRMISNKIFFFLGVAKGHVLFPHT